MNFAWFTDIDHEFREDLESDLPAELFRRLEGGKRVPVDREGYAYATREDSESALVAAWRKARKGGWTP